MDDEKIVQLYLNRDEDAIKQTAEKYGQRIRAISYRITEDREMSEECENDTYLEIWNRIPPNEPKNYFFAFAARIVRFVSIDRCRKLKALKRDAFVVELTNELEMCIPNMNDVSDSIDAKLLGEAINRFLHTLPDEKQLMFVLRYFYLCPVSEISKRLNASNSKIKTTLFRIRNELRNYLLKEGYTL